MPVRRPPWWGSALVRRPHWWEASVSEALGSEGSGYAPNSPHPAKGPASSKASPWGLDVLPSLSVQILRHRVYAGNSSGLWVL